MNSPLPAFPASPPSQTVRWMTRPFDLLDEARQRCGPEFSLSIWGWGDLAMVSRPAMVEQVFRDSTIYAGMANKMMEPLVGEGSIFVVDGDRHTSTRRRMMAGMRAHGRLDGDAVARTTSRVFGMVPDEDAIALHAAMARVTLSTIIDALFGGHRPEVEGRFRRDMRLVMGPVGAAFAYLAPVARSRWSPIVPVMRALQRIDAVIEAEAGEARAGRRTEGLIAHWVTSDTDALEGSALRDQVVSFVGAATDTTASALAWTVLWVCRTRGLQAQLRDELGAVGAVRDRDARTPLLDSVIHEALRISPVAELMSRTVRVDGYEVDGVAIPRGALLSACSYLTHRDPEIYEAPDQFRPDRFVGRTFSPFEYYPFGGGQRRCLGSTWAFQTMAAVLTTLFEEYRVEVVAGGAASRRNVTVTPAKGPSVRLHPVGG